jgi:hypothetical protein
MTQRHFKFKRIFSLSFVALTTFLPTSYEAFAQDEVGDEQVLPDSHTDSPSQNSMSQPQPTLPSSPSDSNQFKIGPTFALGLYQFATLGVEARVSPEWSFALSAGGIGHYDLLHDQSIENRTDGVSPGGNIDDIDASFVHVEAKGMWFPWGKTFFMGLAGGFRRIQAKSDVTITTDLPDTSIAIYSPVEVNFAVSGAFITPSIGWRGLWDSGFLLATEFGAQLFFYSRVDSFDVDTSQVNSSLLYDVVTSQGYKTAISVLQDDVAPYLKNRPLFYWDIIRIGYLF